MRKLLLMKNRILNSKDNKGSTLVTVIIIVAFLSILGTIMLYLSGDNYKLKIIFAAQKYHYNSWAINGTTLAYGVIVRLINPVNGNELRTFVDYTESSTTEAFHVPDVSSTSSYGPKPASSSVGAWINVFEKYMFNNSVYFGIYVPPTYKEYEWSSTEKDNSQNCIAFSYYMED